MLASSTPGVELGAEALRGQLEAQDQALALAFSGGPDSHALLAWAKTSLRVPPILLHVHHGLGAGSDDALAAVERVAEAEQLELLVERVEVQPGSRGLEAAARRARYEALGNLAPTGLQIALGHGWNDWVESLWLRLLSGSSPLFWSGPQLRDGAFVRPLIDQDQGQHAHRFPEAFSDPMNEDTRFERVWLRRSGLLERLDPRGEVAWAIHCLGRRARALEPATWDQPLDELPEGLRRLVIRAQIAQLKPHWRPRTGFIEALCEAAGTRRGGRWFSMAGERLDLRRGKLVLNRVMRRGN
ncbi:MAG: hypothetical protein CMH55_07985 [Myxococcales bacterium]|nr:hypothetical protein [Myxococcales bacterium]